jgi:hypothetical protein
LQTMAAQAAMIEALTATIEDLQAQLRRRG